MSKVIKKKKSVSKKRSISINLLTETKSISFKCTFRNESNGFVEMKILGNAGQIGDAILFNKSSTKKVELEKGDYLISIKGANPAGEAIFNIMDQDTDPITPETFGVGPIFKTYLLQIQ